MDLVFTSPGKNSSGVFGHYNGIHSCKSEQLPKGYIQRPSLVQCPCRIRPNWIHFVLRL